MAIGRLGRRYEQKIKMDNNLIGSTDSTARGA